MILAGLVAASVQVHAAAADSQAGRVTTAGGRLNVRSSASTGAQVVTSLVNGSHVTLMSRAGSWWQVEYAKGKYGYCHTDYITQLSGSTATVATASSSLNVRSGAGTSYTKIASLYKGETVIVLGTTGNWSRILFHGTKTGYVSTQYLSKTGYSAATLYVPNYKQTDSRWANTQIGSSGKTMAQIGCATTAIAMIESYRTGSTIYPNNMVKQLRYTVDGSVYWPSHYKAVTDSANYLARIYALLMQGKPVLLGARNSYGKQHWVVVTGFTGGQNLSPSAFTIHDPGSGSRTTLQQFLNTYPVFYKYFYY